MSFCDAFNYSAKRTAPSCKFQYLYSIFCYTVVNLQEKSAIKYKMNLLSP